MPRISSHASVWPRIVPSWARMVRSFAQCSSSRAPTSAPAIRSEWPLRYLVAECMTMSAPSSIGRVSTGVATVGIDGEHRAGLVRDLGGAGDIGDRPGRVGRRLEPDQLGGAGLHRGGDGIELVGIDELDLEAPLRGKACQPVAQRPVHDLRCNDMIARGEGEEAGASPHSCRTRRPAPSGRPRGRPAWLRPGRMSDCPRAHRCGRNESHCPRRADTCSPCGSAARRPSSLDRSSPWLGLRATLRRSSYLSSWHRDLTNCLRRG